MQRAISELVARGVKDPRVGSVTITEVKIAADMSSAKIFFTPFASKNAPDDVREGLNSAAGFLRAQPVLHNESELFTNLNTLADYERARSRTLNQGL